MPDDDQVTANLAVSNEPPSAQHWLGTDPTGYDELGRLMYGGQASLEVGIAAALLATVFGTCTAPCPDTSAEPWTPR